MLYVKMNKKCYQTCVKKRVYEPPETKMTRQQLRQLFQMTPEKKQRLRAELEKQLQDPTSAAFKQKREELQTFIRKKRKQQQNSTRKLFAPTQEFVTLTSDEE